MTCPFETMKETLKTGGLKTICSDQLFPTPPKVIDVMFNLIQIELGDYILEPSAGTGVLVNRSEDEGGIVTTCEISPELCNKFGYDYNCDFLELDPVTSGIPPQDIVIMNPPFSKGRDILHIKHALKFLKDGGSLVAICANGPRQQEQLMSIADHWEPLPQGSFKSSGTMVNTAIVYIRR